MKKCILISVLSLILSISFGWDAFAQMPNAYGPPINLEAAKKAAAIGHRRGAEKQLEHGCRHHRHRWRPRLFREDGWYPDGQRQSGDR